jgi:hypothetical protein
MLAAIVSAYPLLASISNILLLPRSDTYNIPFALSIDKPVIQQVEDGLYAFRPIPVYVETIKAVVIFESP